MSPKSLLKTAAFAALCGLYAADGMAAMRYDLRFTDGTKERLILPGDPASVHEVQLYAVIDSGANANFADDSITGGFANIYSGKVGNGVLAPGSGLTNAVLGPAVFPAQSVLGTSGDLRTNPNYNIFAAEANADNVAPAATKDGILDWGSDQTYFGSLAFNSPNQGLQVYTRDGVNGAASASMKYAFSPPLVPGGGVGNAVPGNPNQWEVLLATFTVAVNGVSPAAGQSDKTTFTPFTYHRIRATSASGTAADGMAYANDGSNAVPGRLGTRLQDIPGLFDGVSFVTVPEPSTFVLCGLAGLGTIFALRRRS